MKMFLTELFQNIMDDNQLNHDLVVMNISLNDGILLHLQWNEILHILLNIKRNQNQKKTHEEDEVDDEDIIVSHQEMINMVQQKINQILKINMVQLKTNQVLKYYQHMNGLESIISQQWIRSKRLILMDMYVDDI
jgi:hypothetical protein